MHPGDSPDTPGPAPLELDGHDFVQPLGTTPLARVGCYRNRESGTHVVVKEIHPEVCRLPGVEERFDERVALLAGVGHPDSLRLLGYGRTDAGGLYLIREYVDGFTLRAWMDTTAIDHAGALHIVATLAAVIETLHCQGCAHGAVGATSVWIGKDSGIKLEMLPLSALLEPAQLVQLLGLEVVNTMPPEFTSGAPATPRSDVYAVAALYYELLTGTAPRGAINRISASAKVDFRVSQVILRALAPDPARRQADMSEFCAPLLGLAAAGSAPPVAAPHGPLAHPRPRKSIIKPLLASLCLAGVAAGLGGYFWIRSNARKSAVPKSVATSEKTAQPDKKPEKLTLTPAAPKVPDITVAPPLKVDEIDGGSEPVEMENTPERERAVVRRPPPPSPPPSPNAGDAYIYAAHFYQGGEVGLLKLQFGNAGKGTLPCHLLSFQCAFSTDDRLDALAPANSEVFPEPGIDIAAGGFTSKWLGLDRAYLMAGKKLWTKHTFRIDTGNPDLLARAKYLLVKISPLHAIAESDYQNNVIAIPLDHPDQWHTVTQDPTDAEPATDGDAPPAEPPARP